MEGAFSDPDKALNVLTRIYRRDSKDHAKQIKEEARMAVEADAQAYHAALLDPQAFVARHGKPRDRGPIGSISNAPPSNAPVLRVADMTPEERYQRLRETPKCTTCGDTHFGPRDEGCAGNKDIPLPPNFKNKVSPARFKKIMALRTGQKANMASSIENSMEDTCYPSLEELEEYSLG